MRLQLPFIRRILDDNPNVGFHIWNLAQRESDNQYLRSLHLHDDDCSTRCGRPMCGITVINDLYSDELPWQTFNEVYRFYAQRRFENHLFVKLDDDMVFVESQRFPQFIDAVDDNRGSIVSAQVVNNGASTRTQPGLWAGFEQLSIPLLDVHLSAQFADMAHQYFFTNWRSMLEQPVEAIPTQDWVSINMIGYDWQMGRRLAYRLGRPTAPCTIAGRVYDETFRIGDEGACNLEPRLILQGFTAAHLSFGPQLRDMTPARLAELRAQYADIGQLYLVGEVSDGEQRRSRNLRRNPAASHAVA